jgi:hypothetical protein
MMKPLLLFLSMVPISCRVDHRASGEVESVGEQRVTVEVILRMDISGCLELPEHDRLECVKTVAESLEEITNVAEVLLCYRDLEAVSGDEGVDTPISCRDLASVEDGKPKSGR